MNQMLLKSLKNIELPREMGVYLIPKNDIYFKSTLFF